MPISGATYRAETTDELVERAAAARAELDSLDAGTDPVEASARALGSQEREVEGIVQALGESRRDRVEGFATAVAAELRGLGVGEGEFEVELSEREVTSTGRDDVRFLVRPNAGLPLAPVSETASGGELSRIALAIAAVGGGETMVFDEIDAGVGGETAHAVADTLVRLADTGAGRHDHPSAADREPRGAALRGREDPGRSDAHAHSRADAGRAA